MDHLSERLKNLLNQVEKLNLTFDELKGKNDELEIGSFELDIFEININKIKTYEEELIKCER